MDYTDSDIKRIKEVFKFCDKDKDGNINMKEAELAFIGLGSELNEKEKIDWGKEEVDFDNFLNKCKEKKVSVNDLDSKLKNAFKTLETGKSGFVSVEAITSLLENDGMDPKEIQQIIREAQPDKTKNINYEEFIQQILQEVNDEEEENRD